VLGWFPFLSLRKADFQHGLTDRALFTELSAPSRRRLFSHAFFLFIFRISVKIPPHFAVVVQTKFVIGLSGVLPILVGPPHSEESSMFIMSTFFGLISKVFFLATIVSLAAIFRLRV
jgi:hypothetical protein